MDWSKAKSRLRNTSGTITHTHTSTIRTIIPITHHRTTTAITRRTITGTTTADMATATTVTARITIPNIGRGSSITHRTTRTAPTGARTSIRATDTYAIELLVASNEI